MVWKWFWVQRSKVEVAWLKASEILCRSTAALRVVDILQMVRQSAADHVPDSYRTLMA